MNARSIPSASPIESLEPRLHLAATLLKDIHPHTSFTPSPEIVEAAGITFLVGRDDRHGAELWKLDENDQPHLVADLAPGLQSSNPRHLAEVNGQFLFVANVPGRGGVLMRSDGTAAGTTILRDLLKGDDDHDLRHDQSRAAINRLFIAAPDPDDSSVSALYVTDGTAKRTLRLKSHAERSHWHVEKGVALNDLFYFPATRFGKSEFWVTDGTRPGTRQLKLRGRDNALTELARVGDTLFLLMKHGTGKHRIYTLSPTDDKPQLVASFGPTREVHDLAALDDDTVVFTVSSGFETELWSTDGTPKTTTRISDFAPPALGDHHYTAWDGNLYFLAAEGALWRTNGTAEGTVQVRSRNLDPTATILHHVAGDDGVYFLVLTDTDEAYLWNIDRAQTRLVSALGNHPTIPDDSLSYVAGHTFFRSSNPRHRLWISDGTPKGTHPVPPPDTGTHSSAPHTAVHFKGALYFAAKSENAEGYANELWKTDGTPANTTLIHRFDREIATIRTTDDRLLIWEGLDSLGTPYSDLWSSDGTAAGTIRLRDGHYPGIWPTVSGQRYLYAGSETFFDSQLWSTDGTPEGTFLVKAFNPARPSHPEWLATIGGTTYFTADDGTHGLELWTTDGTPAGTVLLADILPGAAAPTEIRGTAVGGTFIFSVSAADATPELWITDGTPANTHMFNELADAPVGSTPAGFTELDGAAYFFVPGHDGTDELWRTDGTPDGTTRVRRLRENHAELFGRRTYVANGRLFFIVQRNDRFHLWSSDGTPRGTRPVKKNIARDGDQRYLSVFAAPDRLLFTTADPRHGRELWQSDGTRQGTRLLPEILPGPLGSGPYILGLFNDNLLISATDAKHGREPWLLPLQ